MDIGSKMSELGQALVRRYTAEGTSLDEKRTMFEGMLRLMNEYQAKNSPGDFGYSKNMYDVIVATPPEIFSLELSDEEIFKHSMRIFQDYVDLSLKELEYSIDIEWKKFDQNTRKNICRSMYTAFEAIDKGLILRQEIFEDQLTYTEKYPDYKDKIILFTDSFKIKIQNSERIIEKELLDIIDLRKRVRKIANSSEKKYRKAMQDIENVKTYIEGVTFKLDAARFKATADNNRGRARFSIFAAILLGAIGLAWGIMLSDQVLRENCKESLLCIPLNIGVRGFLLATSILIIGIYASLRSYFAHSQSEANNRQRFNALESYENMLKLAPSNEARNMIMQKAVECVYSHQSTGFVKEQQKDNDAKTTLVLSQPSLTPRSDPPS